MSAVGLKLLTLLCFFCTALSDPERSQVVWKKAGETVTIECRTSETTHDSLDLCRGFCENDKVVYVKPRSVVKTGPAFRDRVHVTGGFPNVDISIKNLTSADTTPYWCVYKKFDTTTGNLNAKSGGSVYLVVADGDGSANGKQACDTDQQTLLLVTVMISAVVLVGLILGVLIWITLKTRIFHPSETPRRVPNNEVYEEMRPTIRR